MKMSPCKVIHAAPKTLGTHLDSQATLGARGALDTDTFSALLAVMHGYAYLSELTNMALHQLHLT